MKKKISLLMAIILLSIGFLFTGCEKSNLTKVRLCEVTHSVFYAPQYIAINNGYFKEEGLDVELTNGQGSDKVMTALLAGQSDIGLAGAETAIYVYNEGKEDFAQVLAQLTRKDGSVLLSREKEENFTWDQLRGATIIGGRKGGAPYMTLEYVLRKNGLEPGVDVYLDDSIQFSLMAGAFTGGKGNYVTCFEPTASLMEQEGKGYIVSAVGDQTEEIPYTTYLAKKSYISENEDTVKAFVRAVYRGQKWLAENTPEAIAAALLPSFPDTEEGTLVTVIKRYREIGVWNLTPITGEAGFDLLQEVMTQAGELKQKVPYDQIVNNTYAEESMK